jgi:aromatic-L-amino-acid/L-tryptophan decarboxylase
VSAEAAGAGAPGERGGPPAHMTPAQFRAYGRAVIDWIADYHERIESYPVGSRVAPGEIRAGLPAHPPETGEGFDAVLADLDKLVLPGITHWQHPAFFAYFPSDATGPAILADLLSAGLGVQGMLWSTSPAVTEVEQHMLDWLAELLDLGPRFRSAGAGGGVIQDTASVSILTALLAALHRASGGATATDGVGAGRYAVYTSAEAHSAVLKATRMTGLGDAMLRTVEVDDASLAMRPEALAAALAADRGAGITAALVVATVGTTSTSAIDPVPAIGALCREHGVWLHVDAAYAGSAAVCPELRWTHAGVAEFADSYAMNPHKWLLTNFDCGAFWVADRAPLVGAMSVLPEFLRNAATESGAVTDYRDWHPQLGRRFRSLKLWAVLRWYGAEGLRQHIRHGVALAQNFAGWVAADPRFEVVAPHPLSLVCFRLAGGPDADARTEELLRRLNASGALYATHTKVRGRYTIRLAIGSTLTEARHVAAAWDAIRAAADTLD